MDKPPIRHAMPGRALSALLLATLAACSAHGPRATPASADYNEEQLRRGVITRIDAVMLEHPHQVGVGAVLGAAVGGLVGHQFGKGGGRDVATVLGVVGGGLIGHQAESRYAQPQPGQHIFVRLLNGVTVAVTQPLDASLRGGDEVLVRGSGQEARVLRR